MYINKNYHLSTKCPNLLKQRTKFIKIYRTAWFNCNDLISSPFSYKYSTQHSRREIRESHFVTEPCIFNNAEGDRTVGEESGEICRKWRPRRAEIINFRNPTDRPVQKISFLYPAASRGRNKISVSPQPNFPSDPGGFLSRDEGVGLGARGRVAGKKL